MKVRERTSTFKNAKGEMQAVQLGRYIIADPGICHGKPTFKGTRIMVWQVLEDLADGRSWDFICNVRWGGKIPLVAVGEAVRLARESWLDAGGRLIQSNGTVPRLAKAA